MQMMPYCLNVEYTSSIGIIKDAATERRPWTMTMDHDHGREEKPKRKQQKILPAVGDVISRASAMYPYGTPASSVHHWPRTGKHPRTKKTFHLFFRALLFFSPSREQTEEIRSRKSFAVIDHQITTNSFNDGLGRRRALV